MGPWSGGKSTIINYLLDNEFSDTALRTGNTSLFFLFLHRILLSRQCSRISVAGAEPSPAYFNILTHNENETVLDGTQLAADWTFSGLQKFGQALLDRLKGVQMPHPLLEKVNTTRVHRDSAIARYKCR